MYSKILVPVDGSEVGDAGAEEALKLASRLGATLRFFTVVDLSYLSHGGEGLATVADQLTEATRKDAAAVLQRALERAKAAGVTAESGSAEILVGRPGDEILQEAARCKAELVVMGTHGRRGFQRAMLGSDAETVVRGAAVPVLLVPARER